ncbi:hypothetical protein RUM43_000326 [Polyplax serrata]|uniref:Uncharacterized protein n=1 Tax=Polyplax serrata TaxID=468196 RepID=A0AAN8SDV5_POLSC
MRKKKKKKKIIFKKIGMERLIFDGQTKTSIDSSQTLERCRNNGVANNRFLFHLRHNECDTFPRWCEGRRVSVAYVELRYVQTEPNLRHPAKVPRRVPNTQEDQELNGKKPEYLFKGRSTKGGGGGGGSGDGFSTL